MGKKVAAFQNKGMTRDLSISKAPNELAFENFNIRITARDHDTLLSVTNERGNVPIDIKNESTEDNAPEFLSIDGTLLGYSVLNSFLILFTEGEERDHIYRIHYHVLGDPEWTGLELFNGDLNFSTENPIETLSFYESQDVQKVYWVDGENQPRLINIADDRTIVSDELYTKFDFVTSYDNSSLKVTITKEYNGISMPSGTRQIFLTYYNKFGQETHPIYQSPLLYNAFMDRGASPEETTYCSYRLEISGLDTSFDYVRAYALTWTSLNTQPQADIIGESTITRGEAVIVDNGTSLASIDPYSVMYLGGDMISAGTLSQKDNTLFLGNLQDKSVIDSGEIKREIEKLCFEYNGQQTEFVPNQTWESHIVTFKNANEAGVPMTPYEDALGQYPFNNQLQYSSDEIKGFKRGEKYRFAVRFISKEGIRTQAFWIGDKVNDVSPSMDSSGIDRVIVECNLPEGVIEAAETAGYAEVELLMAQPSIEDRSILCQGVVCPTMFNLEQRVNNQPFSLASWIMRPRNSAIPSHHFQPLNDSVAFYSEVQNHFYRRRTEAGTTSTIVPKPYYTDAEKEGKNVTGFTFNVVITLSNSLFNSTSYRMTVKKRYEDSSESSNINFTYGVAHGGNSVSRWDAYQNYSYVWEHVLKFPVSYKISWETWDSVVTDLEGRVPLFGDVNSDSLGEPYKLEKGLMSKGWVNYNITSSIGTEYAEKNSEFFFVDESIITLNSPEIYSNRITIDRNQSVNFRIVGVAPVTANSTGYMADITAGLMPNASLAEVDFNQNNISTNTEGLVSYPLWWDTAGESGDTGLNQQYYMLYMWHKTGSIIGDDSENKHAVLNTKLFANRRFSYRTVYSKSKNGTAVEFPEYELDFLRVHDSDQISLLQMGINNDGVYRTYQGNCDFLVVRPFFSSLEEFGNYNNNVYPIASAKTLEYSVSSYEGNALQQEGAKTVNDPVSIKFKSPVHAVMGFKPTDDGKVVILPSVISDDKPDWNKSQEDENIYLPWNNYEMDSEDETFHIWSNSNSSNIQQLDMSEIIDSGGTPYFLGQLAEKADFESQFSSYQSDSPIYGIVMLEDGPRMFTLKDNDTNVTYISNGPDVTIKSCYLYPQTGNITLELTFQNPKILEENVTVNIELIYPEGTRQVTVNTQGQPQEDYRDVTYTANVPISELNLQLITSMTITVSCQPLKISYMYLGNEFAETAFTRALVVPDGGAKSSEVTVINAPIYEFSNEYYGKTVTLYNDFYSSSYYLSIGEDGSISIGIRYTTDYEISQDTLSIKDTSTEDMNKSSYVFIGELFRTFGEGSEDTRYGGINEAAIENNTFIPCGRATPLRSRLLGTEGDTYVQRYDFIKSMPVTDEDENQVLDITSVMIETHENLDGRYDNQRFSNPVDINYNNFNQINPVYSQQNSFIPSSVLDSKYNLSYYPAQIVWSEEKSLNEDIDTWTGIHLISSLQLDGDRGPVKAIRRFQNSLIAFQDKGIAEILFNSRTQLSTTEGVPIEIANSGKVDGKRYVTDKAGCVNKWSIVETGKGIYFIDNINSSISVFNGSVQSLSDAKGFKSWIGNNNSVSLWNPEDFNNFVAYWDRVNDDVYFLKKGGSPGNVLCYNEQLQQFTSFYDYGQVPMMVNVEDKFLSFRNGKLWLQGEGLYSHIFGEYQNFYTLYRVTPDPYSDKTFTNLTYRADMFDMNQDNDYMPDEGLLTDSTFDTLEVWNEYQGNEVNLEFNTRDFYPDNRRKFRIWRTDIPRDRKGTNNPFGLNRMRNPWIYLKLEKDNSTLEEGHNERMEFHDLAVSYYD